MSNFQRIKDMVASTETPEELSCVLAVLNAEQHRACLHNTKMGKCNVNICRQYSNSCCMLGMTEYLKAGSEESTEPVENTQKSNRWDFIKSLSAGDTFEVTLKNNKTVVFEKVHNKAGISFFVLKDLWMYRHHMNPTSNNEGGFPNSDANEWLNNDILYLLPDDLVEKILPRKITQYIDGKEYSTVCKLWIPSVVEVFGKDDWSEETLAIEPTDEHFDWFKEEKHRIKEFAGSADSWWLRSPGVGGSTAFWAVGSSGYCGHVSAGNYYGVAFGFCI